MATWNLRPTLTKEEKAREDRIDAKRKELYALLSKNGVDFLVKNNIDCREVFQKNTDNEMRTRYAQLRKGN